jgi:hypothetical protein
MYGGVQPHPDPEKRIPPKWIGAGYNPSPNISNQIRDICYILTHILALIVFYKDVNFLVFMCFFLLVKSV